MYKAEKADEQSAVYDRLQRLADNLRHCADNVREGEYLVAELIRIRGEIDAAIYIIGARRL